MRNIIKGKNKHMLTVAEHNAYVSDKDILAQFVAQDDIAQEIVSLWATEENKQRTLAVEMATDIEAELKRRSDEIEAKMVVHSMVMAASLAKRRITIAAKKVAVEIQVAA